MNTSIYGRHGLRAHKNRGELNTMHRGHRGLLNTSVLHKRMHRPDPTGVFVLPTVPQAWSADGINDLPASEGVQAMATRLTQLLRLAASVGSLQSREQLRRVAETIATPTRELIFTTVSMDRPRLQQARPIFHPPPPTRLYRL